MRRLALWGSIAVLLSLAASSASADTVRPLPFTNLQPADGLSLVADDYPYATDAQMFDYVIDTSFTPKPTLIVVEVSTQNIPGQDGTLADDFLQDFTLARPSDAYPTIYKVRTSTADAWLSKPGTYYWQGYATIYDYATGCEPCQYVTPVRTVTVTPKPAPAATPTVPVAPKPTPVVKPPVTTITPAMSYVLRLDVAVRRAKAYIKSHRNARRPTATCIKRSRSTAVCTVKWRSRGHKRSMRLDVVYDQDGYWVSPH